MRLSISNIAWDVVEDEPVSALLNKYRVDAIDIAPGKYFPQPTQTTDCEIANVKAWWSSRGIEIVGMQALLFGTTGLNVFGDASTQLGLLAHLDSVCRIGAGLGARKLVFGSPRNRDRSGLTDEQVQSIATAFFRRLGMIAERHNVVVCLEPNPTHYGANFMTTTAETAQVVREVHHPSIQMQFDSGAITLNREHVEAELSMCANLISHIHASEPDLVPLGDHGADHHAIHEVLARFLPSHVVTIEMLATQNEPHLDAIERALKYAVQCYRPTATGRP